MFKAIDKGLNDWKKKSDKNHANTARKIAENKQKTADMIARNKEAETKRKKLQEDLKKMTPEEKRAFHKKKLAEFGAKGPPKPIKAKI